MIRRQCTTLAAAANGRLFISLRSGWKISARSAHRLERIGNFRNVRPLIVRQVRLAAWSEGGSGSVRQHRRQEFFAGTLVISTIAGATAGEQLWRSDSNRMLTMAHKRQKPIGISPALSSGEHEAAVAAFIH